MTFQSKEISNQDGNDVSLYMFKWGNTYWRYTSADRDIEFDDGTPGAPHDYLAIAITDTGLKQGGSANNDMTVNMQADTELVALFATTPPSGSIWLTIRRMHYDDGEALVHWVGTVGNVKRLDLAQAAVICRSLLATFKKTGIRLCWTRGCPHMLYDSECRVDPADYAVLGTVLSKTGNSVTISGAAAGFAIGYFNGGYIEWSVNADATKDRRQILSSTSATVHVLLGTTDRIDVGEVLTFYPGCDLTTETCDDKFDNLANYGGLEQMTDESLFDGKPIA